MLEAIDNDPLGQVGQAVVERFGPRLPFLLKVLAADEPLSLQAHPSARQAVAGFPRENAAGVPLESPLRNYKDPSHKTEMICALTEFHAPQTRHAPTPATGRVTRRIRREPFAEMP